MALALLSANTHAGTYTLLPPQGFQRESGAPVTRTITFPARDTVSTYTIYVYNGGLEDHELTGELVSSSVIALNGSELFSPSEFNQQTTTLSKTINVQSSNELAVELRGKPGGVITLEIIGVDNIPPFIEASIAPAANAEGWHKSAVTVSFTCDDGASGVKVCPEPVTVSVDGVGQVVSGTAMDYAGNEASTSVTLNIDQTLPIITPVPDPTANGTGWNQSAVTVSFDCQDGLSGVAECSAPVTVSGEGAGQTVSGQVRDTADNEASVSHTLNIDLTPPNIATELSAPANVAGWHKADVNVNFVCDDALSGIVACPATVPITTEAASQTVNGSVFDLADNSSSASVTINLDKTPPSVTPLPEPVANAAGWNRSTVTVGFDCQDGLSGVAECSAPVTVSGEGAVQIVNGQGRDIANNTTDAAHTLNIDLTAPNIATELSVPANAAGWHNGDVTVGFVCDDTLSGIVACPAAVPVTIEAANQVVSGSVLDQADNSSSTSTTINLDKTPPSVTPLPEPVANAAGWNKSAVTVSFDCQDGLSGVAECSAPIIVSGEGAAQIVNGQGRDSADNTTAISQTLNIDLTAPNITTALSAPANAAGWHKADVSINFVCDDALSGIVACPAPVPVTTEVANQVISGSVLDQADNSSSASATINLDKTPPSITPLLEPAANAAGWNKSAVTVSFDCQDSLSGVAECSAPVTVSGEGAAQIVNGQSRDSADNTTAVSQTLNIDLTAPVISAGLSTPANAAGWHKADVNVNFVCDDALSGIVECPAAVPITTEAASQTVSGSVLDLADNSSSTSTTVNLDKTPPSVTPLPEPIANAAGWNRSTVTVSFDCQDSLSSVAECSAPVTVSGEGAAQVVNGQGRDSADNTTAVSQTLNIDLTAPVIDTQFSASPNAAGWYNAPVTLTFTCTDNLSGIQSCPEPITVSSDAAGHNLSVSALDLAGNSTSQSHTLNLDAIAPQIAITAPAAGVELATLQPQIQLTLSDNLALDGASLTLTVNGQPFPGQCVTGSGTATCTPESNFPRGAIHIEASVADLAGNPAGAQLDFRIQEDRDGDNVADVDDLFPDDPTEWADLDGDGTGDNSDPDRDGDGISNDYENQAGTDPNDATITPPDRDGDGIPDSLDPDRDGDGFSNDEELLAGSNPDDPQDIPSALFIGFNGETTTTQGQFTDLQGPARGENLKRVFLRSAQFASVEFAATLSGLDNLQNRNASWQARIPLEVGDNAITAVIENTAGEQASVSFSVHREEVSPVIELTIDTPADNALLTEPGVVITGRVISEQAVSLPAVQVNGTAAQVTQGGTPTEFAFTAPLTLSEGANLITASSVVAGQALQRSLTLNYQPQTEQLPAPVIAIRSPQPGSTLNAESFTLSAEIQAEAGLAEVTLDGQPVTLASGNLLQQNLSFAEGQTQMNLVITATDNLQQSSSFSVEYRRDSDAPVIQVDQLQPFPVENTLTENPHTLSGTVSDAALSQFSLNGQNLTLQPTETVGSYRFAVPVTIAPGPATSAVLQAADSAGNQASVEYLLVTGSDVQIDWLTPDADSHILLESAGQTLDVGARLSTTLGVGTVQVEMLQAGQPVLPAQAMTLEAGIASAQLTLPQTEGGYILRIQVLDAATGLLASSSRTIELQPLQALPLQIVKATPADEAADIEPNEFIAVFFNQPIELAKLELLLNETAHGFTYVDVDPSGTDSLQAKGYVLQEVNRDHEAVPGVLSLLPNDTTALFYPQRDLAYDADLYLSVRYDGAELLRRHFRTRPRPTFIEGVVLDNLGQPVVNVEVTLPELERTATTNGDGAFSFGYGDTAEQTLPSGNYRLLVNAGLKDRRFGSHAGLVNVEAGARNQVNTIQLPLLNQAIPFSHLNSGAVSIINGGEVSLDASAATYTFGDGRQQGAAHVQFLPLSSVREPVFDVRYTPLWVYGLQPKGIAVQGQLQVEFALPKFQGTYDYAPREGELVLLLGNGADGTRLVPVGVGQTLAGQRIAGIGDAHWQTLDYIAYARVIPEQWADLRAYQSGQISLETLALRLQTYRFDPPADQAEAEQRAAEILEAQ